jgi:hypothetical protein
MNATTTSIGALKLLHDFFLQSKIVKKLADIKNTPRMNDYYASAVKDMVSRSKLPVYHSVTNGLNTAQLVKPDMPLIRKLFIDAPRSVYNPMMEGPGMSVISKKMQFHHGDYLPIDLANQVRSMKIDEAMMMKNPGNAFPVQAVMHELGHGIAFTKKPSMFWNIANETAGRSPLLESMGGAGVGTLVSHGTGIKPGLKSALLDGYLPIRHTLESEYKASKEGYDSLRNIGAPMDVKWDYIKSTAPAFWSYFSRGLPGL